MRKVCLGHSKRVPEAMRGKKRGPYPHRHRTRGGFEFRFENEATRHASLMRHGSYRRKMRAEKPDQECYW